MRRYPVETVDEDMDDGTITENVNELERAVIGRRIVKAELGDAPADHTRYGHGDSTLVLTLDDGTMVRLVDTNDCCAYTELKQFLLHPERVDHAITGVGTTEGYTKWHIYADLGDVLELDVEWSCGNPFYYGYGFYIAVEPLEGAGS